MAQKKQEDQRGKGLIFIVSAPSGAGKTTLVRRVMEELQGLRFSISHTTRPPRANEREGEDYYFITSTVFKEMVEKERFLEWAEVLGNFYGTVKVNMEALASDNLDLILDIDTQGAKRVKEKIDQAILIYLLPPSMEVLKERLVRRGLDSPERIEFRLAQAKKDMEEAHWYQYILVNDRFEEAVEKLKAIIIAERQKKSSNVNFIQTGGE